MPELRKPDMPAVLERTNLARHIGAFLLPIFEAMSNSIHSIADRFGIANVQSEGRIRVIVSDQDFENFSVQIVDNSEGLNENNFKSFLTPFTGNKLRKNGKGFGRFIAFKVFKDIFYETKISGHQNTKKFKFDIYKDEEVIPLEDREHFLFDQGCSVTYRRIKDEYVPCWRELDRKKFLDHLTQNFLTYLVDGRMPETTVTYDGSDTDLRNHFNEVFSYEETHVFAVELDGLSYSFKLDVARVNRGDPFDRHSILFFADNRILGKGRSIEAKLGKSYFERADGSEYVVIAAISGDFLDTNANNDRTFLEAPESDVVEIIDKACELIQRTEKEQGDKIKSEQRLEVVALLQGHPLLRFGLGGKTVEQYVQNKPANWNKEKFVSDLAVQRLRAERRWTHYLKESFADKLNFKRGKMSFLRRLPTSIETH